MTMSPHQIFGRLQELKKWQQTHEKLLKRSSFDENTTTQSAPHDNSGKSEANSLKNPDTNQDCISIAPGKNFEQLLEEKLNEYAEDSNMCDSAVAKPKKPFLKKGTGLLKYNLKPDEYRKLIANKSSNTTVGYRRRNKSAGPRNKPTQDLPVRPQTSGGEKKSRAAKPSQPIKTTSNLVSRTKTAGVEYSGKKNCDKYKVDSAPSTSPKLNRKKKHVNGQTQNTKIVRVAVDDVPPRPKTVGDEPSKKNLPSLHDFIENISRKPIEFTPLKIPDFSIKPRGNWCDASVAESRNEEISQNNKLINSLLQCDKTNVEVEGTSCRSEWKNGLVKQINEMTNTMGDILDIQKRKHDFKEMGPQWKEVGARKSLSYECPDQSLYEKALETELLIFEALERRAEQSGFSSTNSSIIQLLASTPSKFNLKNSGINTGRSLSGKITNNIEETDQPVKEPQHNQIENFNSHFSPRNEFRPNDPQIVELEEDSESDEEVEDCIERNEGPVERKDSSVNMESPETLDDNFSTASSDITEQSSVDSIEVHENNKMSESVGKTLDISESCASCGHLIKDKIEECQSELDNLKMEKNRIVAIREQMAREKQEFEKEMKARRRQFEEQRLKFQLELEEEKRKLSEKQVIEKPNKDFKLKTQLKKDREEINNLKMELNETKELMKLRETKNATCMARLRSQIKLLEKNNSELKAENERLLRENSRLTAQQKTSNKSTETKMLKEISRNLSKLTEETFKNQYFRTDTSSEDDSKRNAAKNGSKGDSENNSKKSSKQLQGLNKSVTQSCHGHGEGLIKELPVPDYTVQCVGDTRIIEEKYRSLFGGNNAIIEEIATSKAPSSMESTRPPSLGKTERVLEDGTKEIRYSNGNVKLISQNGTVRYYYSSNDTWHTNFADGTEVIEFPNGQSEKRFKDGKCLIFFPDGLIQTIFPDSTEEVKYPDGSRMLTKSDGNRMLFLANGQVEIHTKDQKRREYPDGTVKILYPDGTQETRYSNGRIRIKNSEGEIILDTGDPND